MEEKKTAANLDEVAGISRRSFLQYAGITAASMSGLAFPQLSEASRRMDSEKNESLFWSDIRKEFIIDRKLVYMNLGTTGSMPKKVLKNYEKYNYLSAFHPGTFESELGADLGLPAQREVLAGQFGCNVDEICLSRNTTDGLDAIIYGLQWQPGDEILLTHHEHIAALSPLNVIQDRYGVVLTEVEIPVIEAENSAQFVDAFAAKIGPNTKAILFSHITYKTGARLPAKELCDLARENGLISIVDGAHGPGMIQLNFHDIGCDFYAAPGHKWQCGPGSTGILYLRNHGDDLPEFWTQNSSLYTYAVQPFGNIRGTFDVAVSLQYRGQLNIPAQLAMVDACRMWEEMGRDRIEHYVCGLSSYLKKALKNKFGDIGTYFSPDIPELTSGLTSFNPFSDLKDPEKIATFVNRLHEEANYQIRSTEFHLHADDAEYTHALRFSTHIFHNENQIDTLVDALYDLYLGMET